MRALKRFIKRLPIIRSIARYLYDRVCNLRSRELFHRGHYYSPLPNIAEVQSNAKSLFRKDVKLGASIELREHLQESLLEELATFYQDFDWPKQASPSHRYYSENAMFGPGSAFSLYAMLRRFRPKRVIEIGSGFSSAVMLDTSERFLDNQVQFTFIEPCPKRLLSILRSDDHEHCRIVEDVMQNVPVSTFRELEPNDFLFIDSSHVSKIGSDVNFYLFEILPVVQSGVIIHIHDVYWPFEYPQSWITKGIAWNEAYLLRAFLQYNNQFEILQFNSFLAYRFSAFFSEHLPGILADPGSSIWLRKRVEQEW